MKQYKELFHNDTINTFLSYPINKIAPLEDILFFDIETTGLHADISNIYLIGCLIFEQSSWQLLQWFADDYRSEKAMLEAFFQVLATKRTIIHFNGTRFDLPFVLKKCLQHDLPYTFDSYQSIDLYKLITPYKTLWNLPNYKQKTVEDFLHIERNDLYSGGELIPVYVEYIKAKYGNRSTNEHLTPLLLHNKEDLLGMMNLTQLFHYIDIFQCNTTIQNVEVKSNYIEVLLYNDYSFPSPLTYVGDYMYVELKERSAIIRIGFFEGELKYFFDNYKDYFYMTKEDKAIHKSIATYVEKEYREKAKASTCYERKSGRFLPCPSTVTLPHFRYDYYHKQSFIQLNEELLCNKRLLLLYLKEMLLTMKK